MTGQPPLIDPATVQQQPLPPLAPLPSPAVSVMATPVDAVQQAPGMTDYSGAIQRIKQRDRKRWEDGLRQAIGTDPDLYAESQRLAKQAGIPQDVAERNIDHLRGLSSFLRTREAIQERVNPTLYRAFKTLDFAKKAADDAGSLGLGERISRSFMRGRLMVELGQVSERMMENRAQPNDAAREKWLRAEIEKGGADGNWLVNVAETLGQVAQTTPKAIESGIKGAFVGGSVAAVAGQAGPQVLLPEEALTVPAGMVAGFGAGFLAEMGRTAYVTEAGNAYSDMVARGFDPDMARRSARGIGLVNAALEVVGIGLVTKPLVAAAKRRLVGEVSELLRKPTTMPFLREYTRQIGTETGQETAQEISSLVGQWMAESGREGEQPTTWGEAWDRVVGVAYKTATSQAILGVPGAVIHARHMAAKAARAKELHGYVENMTGVVVDGKLLKRDPEAFEAHTKKMLAEADSPTHFYVDGAAFANVLRQADKEGVESGKLEKATIEQVDAIVPGLAEQINEAERTGGDVAIPAEVYMARLATRPELNAKLAPLLRDEVDGVALGDADRVAEEAAAILEQETGAEAIFLAMEKARAAGTDLTEALVSAGVKGEKEQGRYLLADRERMLAKQRQAIAEEVDAGMAAAMTASGTTKVSAYERQTVSRIAADLVADLAAREGVEPAKFWQKNRLAFGVRQPGAEAMQQDDRGGFAFDESRLALLFTKETDASTLMHELGHYWIHVVQGIASQPGASESIMADFNALLARWGVQDVAAWQALDAKQREKHAEDFTYNLEDYLATGEAPTAELQGLFDRIKTWISRVYRFVRERLNAAYQREFGVDLPALTPELRAVFDRMFASQDAIDATRAARESSLLFMDDKARKAAGVTDEQAKAIADIDAASKAAAAADLQGRGLKGAKSVEIKRGQVLKEQARRIKEAREAMRSEAEKEVRARPEFMASAQIAYGTVVDENGVEQSAKMDTDAVRSILGDDVARIPVQLTRKDGQSPDLTAEQFGYDNGEQMLRAIIDAGSVEQAIEARIDERMAAEQSELLDAKAQEREVLDAMHNTARARLLATELKALLKAGGPVSEQMAAAKAAARRMLERMAVGEISPRRFSVAEFRAHKAAREALAEGDVAAAVDAQRKALVQHYLLRLSLDAQKQVDTFVGKRVGRVFADDEKLAKSHDINIVNAARAILARHGFGTIEQAVAPEKYLELVKEYDPELWSELDQDIRQSTFDAKPWKELRLDQFRIMADAVDNMMTQARNVQTIEVDGKRIAKRLAIDNLVQRGLEGPLGRNKGKRTTKTSAIARGKAWLSRFEAWALYVDGGTPGPWTKTLYRPLAIAMAEKRVEATKLKGEFERILKSMGPMYTEKIDASKWLGTDVVFNGTAELLGAVQHIGNRSNKQKLIGGRGWGAQVAKDEFSEAAWDEFFLAMQQAGKITQAHMDGIQAIWDLNDNTLKPAAQRVNREVKNKYFDEIQADPVQTIWGTYRGGYIPATPDPAHPSNFNLQTAKGLEAVQNFEQHFAQSMPGVNAKFTIARQVVFRPLLLDLRLAGSHIDDALQFIHLQKPIRTIARIVRDKEFAAFLTDTDPNAVRDILLPMMERVAFDRITKPVLGAGFANWLRRSATLAHLAGSMRNILQQLTGLINATNYAPTGDLLRAARGAFFFGRSKMVKQMLDDSTYMRDRVTRYAEEITNGIERQLNPGFWKDAQRKLAGVALLPQQITQMQTDLIVWHAAYSAAVRKLGTADDAAVHAEAVQRADAAVRLSQGSQTPLDVANAFGQNAWVRLMTQFGDYANVMLQPILLAQNQRERAVAALKVLILPSIASSAIAAVLSRGSELEDDDEDGDYADDWMRFWLGGIARTGLGSIPVAGSAAGSLLFGKGRADERINPFPAWSFIESSARIYGQMAETHTLNGQGIKDVAILMSAITGIPFTVLGRGAGYAMDVSDGKRETTGPVDYVFGLINGR